MIMNMSRRPLSLALAAGTILAGSAPVLPQFSSNLEAPLYTGSTTGVSLSNGSLAPGGGGQDDWYNPTGSLQHAVYTYAGNAPPWIGALGPIPTNPQGSGQFAAGSFNAGADFARAQH